PRFVRELRQAGVIVFDVTPAASERDRPLFLRQDTHWTPVWMEGVATELSVIVLRVGKLTPLEHAPQLGRVGLPATRVGDIVDMLKLPDGQMVFAPDTVTIHQVRDGQGN